MGFYVNAADLAADQPGAAVPHLAADAPGAAEAYCQACGVIRSRECPMCTVCCRNYSCTVHWVSLSDPKTNRGV